MSDHAKEFEPKIRKIQEQLNRMVSEKHGEHLLEIVRRPGFTTPQEAQFVHAMLDALGHHLEGIDRAQRALVSIADQIGRT
ncbi:MAG: hypothetical protein JO189_31695 [Deltaproteobacteria bacterium]|nr:hypothetical protein [Deltaproteobacteria bacterium]